MISANRIGRRNEKRNVFVFRMKTTVRSKHGVALRIFSLFRIDGSKNPRIIGISYRFIEV